jgi:hypothetical protein
MSLDKKGKEKWFPQESEREGALRELGYDTHSPDLTRHEALNKAIKRYGRLTVFHMLQAKANVRKGVSGQQESRKIFLEDAKWASPHKKNK